MALACVLVRVVCGRNKLKSNETIPYANVRYQIEEIPIKSDTRTHIFEERRVGREEDTRRENGNRSSAMPLFVCLFVSCYFRNFSSMRVPLVPYSNFVAPKHNTTRKISIENASENVCESTHTQLRTHTSKKNTELKLSYKYTERSTLLCVCLQWMQAREKSFFFCQKERENFVHSTWKAMVACICRKSCVVMCLTAKTEFLFASKSW